MCVHKAIAVRGLDVVGIKIKNAVFQFETFLLNSNDNSNCRF